MCGLAGILHFDSGRPVDPGVLEDMISTVRSRGPEGTGLFTEGPVGLAHARLRIIDLEGGDQPIFNEDRSIATVLNGEIFNYLELRDELRSLGHRFSTNTDTEVLVHLYEEEGPDFLHRLNGQFAFALWDSRRRRLILARDRPGILPLFFRQEPDRLIFASEVKAILPALATRPSLVPEVLEQIFTFWAPLSPRTIFDGISEVEPGQALLVEGGEVLRRRYWQWEFPPMGEHREADRETLTEELRSLLADATRIRLRSDVPVGAYLSGGLDSSAVAALIHRERGDGLRTFSVGFEDPALDESGHQKEVVEYLSTHHTEVPCSGHQVAAWFPRMVQRTETPVLRTAPVPMGMLSRRVREEGYKVVLTGEGADEVLGGYDLFKEAKVRQFWARYPDSTRRPGLLRRLYPYLELNQQQSQAYLQAFFGVGLDSPDSPFFSHLPRWTTTSRIKAFFSDELKAALGPEPLEALARVLPRDFGSWHPFNRAEYLECRILLASYLLCSQGDRMLMAHSVEGRFPFLDHRLIRFASQLHPRYKMRVLNEKDLLKRAMAPQLPASIVARHKQPYRAPDIPAFFGNAGPPEYVQDALLPDTVRRLGYFDAARVGQLLKKIEGRRAIGAKDNMAFVGILSTHLWHLEFMEGSQVRSHHQSFTTSG